MKVPWQVIIKRAACENLHSFAPGSSPEMPSPTRFLRLFSNERYWRTRYTIRFQCGRFGFQVRPKPISDDGDQLSAINARTAKKALNRGSCALLSTKVRVHSMFPLCAFGIV